jgi:uncharacterized protein (TIGR02284 family)
MTETSYDIRTLNGLIATTLDSADGYETSAADAGDSRFSSLFTARAAERRTVVQQLQAQVSQLGGNPEDDGTLLAGAHRAFVNLKAAVTGRDDKAIVNEVERGEDHIKHKFEAALADGEVSPATKATIEAAYRSVREGHDQMRDIKHSMEGAA